MATTFDGRPPPPPGQELYLHWKPTNIYLTVGIQKRIPNSGDVELQ